jgi:hypothetical protein
VLKQAKKENKFLKRAGEIWGSGYYLQCSLIDQNAAWFGHYGKYLVFFL